MCRHPRPASMGTVPTVRYCTLAYVIRAALLVLYGKGNPKVYCTVVRDWRAGRYSDVIRPARIH